MEERREAGAKVWALEVGEPGEVREAGKGEEQAQGAKSLEGSEGHRVDPGGGRGGQAEARRAVTKPGHFAGCPATPEQALPRTLQLAPFLCNEDPRSSCLGTRSCPMRCFQEAVEGRRGALQGEGNTQVCRSGWPLNSELPEMIFLGHRTP